MRFPTYSSAVAWLYARNQFAVKLGLENPRHLLAALKNPERRGTFLHIAGTNGKGSVCTALAAMLPGLGVQHVGLYTSPHLVSFRERIRIDDEPISTAYVTDWLNRHIELLEELNPTYFEIVTALALCAFREKNCGAVVLETGLGGRLDATNIVTPTVTVVTSIALDHTAILGDSLEAILREKLGIVKPGVPLIIDEARTTLMAIAEATAHDAGAPFVNAADRLAPAPGGWRLQGRFAEYALPTDLRAEEYQIRNAALAVLALEAFHDGALPPPERWLPALRHARMPGRMQRLTSPDHLPVLLDGAHNPAGAEALAAHLTKSSGNTRRRVFFSAMRDKDIAAVARMLASLSTDLVFVDLSLRYPRALSGAEARVLLVGQGFPEFRIAMPETESLLPLLQPGTGADEAVFCGSLFLLGEIIPLLSPHYEGLEEFARMRTEDIAE